VRKLKPEGQGPILCFVGPPGVGKTSLGRSIARALGRNFVRISLGGVRDERRSAGTGAPTSARCPGRIIQGSTRPARATRSSCWTRWTSSERTRAGTRRPAAPRCSDPEQNNSFRDHYLGVPYDLSKVMFIANANLIDPIHPAFRDRMEVIHLSGYTEEEKIQIAKTHLIPKQIEENGLSPQNLRYSVAAIRALIGWYTREAGLRNLERLFASIGRKVARKTAEGRPGATNVTPQSLESFLGPVLVVARGGARGGPGRHLDGSRLDRDRRGHPAHRSDHHEGQGRAHPDGATWETS
jgi:ATP-dependent Lon protease